MRRKRVELEQAVIVAARLYVTADQAMTELVESMYLAEEAFTALRDAVKALDEYEAAELSGAGAKYAAGSDTSRSAAGLAVPIQYSARHQIIAAMTRSNIGYTDDQLENRLGRSHQTISSARNWLVEAGWVRDSGQRRKTSSGRDAVCWELTDAGITRLEQKGNR